MWKDGKYDLLILDVSLPDGCGFEFCKKFGLHQRCRLFFDGFGRRNKHHYGGWILAVMTILQKPFKLGVFVSRINALLRRKFFSGQWIRNCSRMVSKFFAARDRFFKNGVLFGFNCCGI